MLTGNLHVNNCLWGCGWGCGGLGSGGGGGTLILTYLYVCLHCSVYKLQCVFFIVSNLQWLFFSESYLLPSHSLWTASFYINRCFIHCSAVMPKYRSPVIGKPYLTCRRFFFSFSAGALVASLSLLSSSLVPVLCWSLCDSSPFE